MTDAELLDRFERGDLESFRHADHVRVACAYLDLRDEAGALARLADGLRAFAARQGKAERFHYTLTRAWFELILAARRRHPEARTADSLLAACPGLADPGFVKRFYSPGLLDSAAARADWIGPDLAPLDPTLY